MDLEIKVTLKGPWLKTRKLLKAMPKMMNKAVHEAAQESSKVAKKRYAENYKRGRAKLTNIAPLSKDTILWRRTGKTAGTGQSRTPWTVPTSSSSVALNRTGSMWKAIRRRVKKGKEGATFIIDFNPAKRNPEGKKIRDIAAIMEKKRTVTFNVSHKMQAYLMILFGRAVGSGGGRPKSIQPTGKQFTIVIPARPIFQATTAELNKELPRILYNLVVKGLKKQGLPL